MSKKTETVTKARGTLIPPNKVSPDRTKYNRKHGSMVPSDPERGYIEKPLKHSEDPQHAKKDPKTELKKGW